MTIRDLPEHRRLCANKSSREALACRVEEVAARHGAAVDRAAPNSLQPRGLTLYVRLSTGHTCMIHFDGASRLDCFLGHWHGENRRVEYPKFFPGVGGITGSLDGPRRKATICEATFDGFLDALDRGLSQLKSVDRAAVEAAEAVS